jgi:hypothetical protein
MVFVKDDVNGLLVPPRDAERLVQAIELRAAWRAGSPTRGCSSASPAG